ncbi:hypothetical protein EGI11_08810 [Chryseobacterium sp. H3056]|uniref:Bacteriophage spanin2 family protein n=1 Tax=Kaistella daneshvariae TaxID=2487074 RepID=A0A3N0WS87_9FLAO|nr:bacteriophage spanin2 family protein [Kaistella daneshvariae]ROI07775.1 hypothetical protein EGI11_08810 [Kaistella daneshvariae]
MRKLLPVFLFLAFLTSCQTMVVTPKRAITNNSLELYSTYRVQTANEGIRKVKVLKQDQEKIYGKLTSGEDVVINKSDVRTVRKTNVLSSLLVGAAAVAAVVFVPI